MAELACPPGCTCKLCNADRDRMGLTKVDEASAPMRDWKADAALAGQMYSESVHGLWNVAYLVARNVEIGGKGGRPKTSEHSEVSKKVSCAAFARETGMMTDKTVARYYAAWQAAAIKGWVPPAEKLEHYTSKGKPPKSIEGLTDDQWEACKPKTVKLPTESISTGSRPASSTTAADRSPDQGSATSGQPTGSREPIPAQHPLRESETADAILGDFKLANESMALIAEAADQEFLKIIDDKTVAEFMGLAAKVAKRVRSLRKIVETGETPARSNSKARETGKTPASKTKTKAPRKSSKVKVTEESGDK